MAGDDDAKFAPGSLADGKADQPKTDEEQLDKKIAEISRGEAVVGLSKIFMGEAGADRLAKVLAGATNVHTVHLRGNHIGDKGVAALSTAVCVNPGIRTVHLRGNDIGDVGAASLGGALAEEGCCLQTLDLNWNTIGDMGAESLSKALHSNTTLTSLRLNNNWVGPRGATAYADCLRINRTIEHIHLNYNRIEDAGIVALAGILEVNNTILSIEVRGNGITEAGARVLLEAVSKNTSVERVDVGDNGLPRTIMQQLDTALERMERRRKMSVFPSFDMTVEKAAAMSRWDDSDGATEDLDAVLLGAAYDKRIMDGSWDILQAMDGVDSGDVEQQGSLEEVRSVGVQEGVAEVVVVDRRHDAALASVHQEALRMAEQWTTADKPSDRVAALATMVSNHFGGAADPLDEVDIDDRPAAELTALKHKHGSNAVPLGEIRQGNSRHRSLLFKYLADEVGIRAKIFRGTDVSERLAWVVVEQGAQEYAVDLIAAPGSLSLWTSHMMVAAASTPGDTTPSAPPVAMVRRPSVVKGTVSPVLESSNSVPGGHSGAGSSKEVSSKATADESVGRKRGWSGTVAEEEEEPRKAVRASDEALDSSWRIDYDSLDLVKPAIGNGTYGKVYRARWSGVDVAVKKFTAPNVTTQGLSDFLEEVRIMQVCHHPHLLRMFGASDVPGRLAIVTELMHQNLYELLHGPRQLTQGQLVSISRQIAEAMRYLHSKKPPIIHRDLKSSNILLDRDLNVKVGDFGLSRSIQGTLLRTRAIGTFEYMAPEALTGGSVTAAADLYSYGVLVWEIFSRKVPWEGISQMQLPLRVGLQGERLRIEDAPMPVPMRRLVERCWEDDPAKRPSFGEIVDELARV